jgi:hypothetical protein
VPWPQYYKLAFVPDSASDPARFRALTRKDVASLSALYRRAGILRNNKSAKRRAFVEKFRRSHPYGQARIMIKWIGR